MVTSVNELSTQANTKIVKSKPMIYHSLLITEMCRHVQVDICNVIEAKNLSVNNHLLRIAAYVYLQAYLYLQMYVSYAIHLTLTHLFITLLKHC